MTSLELKHDDLEYLHHLLYIAWGVIANVDKGVWRQDPEWTQAAGRWRDEWHVALSRHHGGEVS